MIRLEAPGDQHRDLAAEPEPEHHERLVSITLESTGPFVGVDCPITGSNHHPTGLAGCQP